MAIPRDFLQSIYEDADSFGGDALYQNEMLANIINPPMPVVKPALQLIPTVPEESDSVAQLFASQSAAPATLPTPPTVDPVMKDIFEEPVTRLTPSTFEPVMKDIFDEPVTRPAPSTVAPASPTVAPTTPAPAAKPAGPSQDIINALSQQILGSSDTSKWSGVGYGSAQANAADMAKILANAGLTDVRQLGVKQEVVPAQYFESGEIPEHTVNRYYNKETGQDLGNLGGTYAERQTGNFFGGTFEGKGNTGYGVQFRPDGTPVFYTQGASSNDVAKIMEMAGPVGQIAAAYFGGPAAVAAISAASGKPVGDIIKSAALSYLGNAAGSAVSGMEGITDVLGKTGTDIVSNATKQYVGSGGKVDPLAALLSGSVNAGVNSLLPSLGLDDLTKAQKGMLSSGIMGLVNGQPLDKVLMNAAVSALTAKPDDKLKSGFGPGDPDEFIASLIPGYFQPGGEGYIPPEETDPITVQQQPSGLDDFLSQLEQFKQSAVTPDDIKEIISGQNFATPEDIQSAISNIPAGLTEEDLVKSLGTTKEDLLAQLGTTEEDLQQRIADLESEFGGQITGATQGLESKIAGTQDSVDALAESLGTTKDDLLNELGITEEGLQQRIADLESEFGGQLTESTKGLESKIDTQSEQFQTLLEQYRELGMDENDALRQTIDDLGSTFGEQLTGVESGLSGQISEQGEQFQTLLQQYRDLGMDENEALRQTIDDLGADVSGQFGDLESKLAETQTGVDELAESLGTTREDLLDQLGVTEEEINQRIADLESEFGGNFEDIEGSLEKTREDLFNRFGLSEEEMQQRIADLETEFGGQLTSGLGKQSAETKALFQNLFNQQQSQAAALAKSQAAAAAKAKADAVARAQSEAASSKNNQLQALLAMMSSNNEVAKIKSYKDLFGEDLFGTDIDLTPVGGEAE